MPDEERRRLGRGVVILAALPFLVVLVQAEAPPPAEALPAMQRPDVPPRFRSRPRIEDLFPVRALEQTVTGVAQVQCQIGADGLARDCRVTRETPKGWGFGQAALDGMARSRLIPAEMNGTPVESRVAQAFNFLALGTVNLDCAVAADQTARDCRIVGEEPPGRGLGALALQRAATASPTRWDLDRAENGRFRWTMDVEAPLEDCPQIAGRDGCAPPP